MKKRVKKSKQEDLTPTKDDLEMQNIEKEINNDNTETKTETITTKPDTQILDIMNMLTMMNEKINSLIKDNITLKKELEEIKSNIQNITITKVEEIEENEDITKQNTEVEDDIIEEINEDNTSKTLPKYIVLDHTTQNSVKESKKNVKVFNGKDRDTFITNLRAAYASSKISYIDYVNSCIQIFFY